MDDSQIEDTLAVIAEFRRGSDTSETGLDVDDPALLQLRKACRLMDAVASLRAANGYYTVIIEASFAVIERLFQLGDGRVCVDRNGSTVDVDGGHTW